MYREVINYIKDSLFPIYCVECEKEGEWWCDVCFQKEKKLPFNIKAGGYLDKVTAFFNYQPPVSLLIQQFKFSYVYEISELWEKIIFKSPVTFVNGIVAVPVPLYKTRERMRGFNQAKIICELVSKSNSLIMNNDLVRIKKTVQQSKLTKEERFNNIQGAFKWNGAKEVPEKILLVDDVFTTGATMQECAKVLKDNGAKWVEGIVLAHG